MVPAESSVLVEEQNLEEDLVIIPGLLKVRTREDKQYVSVQVSNKSNSKKSEFLLFLISNTFSKQKILICIV